MLLSPKAYKSLNSVETVSPRIMIASFNRNLAVAIISCYSPTNVSDEEDKDEFYNELIAMTRSIPKQNRTLVRGDMIARIGERDAIGSVYNYKINENGQRLLDYIQDCRMQALNTRYIKRKRETLGTHTTMWHENTD